MLFHLLKLLDPLPEPFVINSQILFFCPLLLYMLLEYPLRIARHCYRLPQQEVLYCREIDYRVMCEITR